jgi:hypothetical protein
MAGEDPSRSPSDRGPALSRAPGGQLHHGGVLLYPSGDPAAAARARALSAPLAEGTLVYVPSVGLGLGLADLLARLPEECAVLCVETDPALMRRAEACGLPADPRLVVVQTADPDEAARAARALGIGRFRRVAEVPLSAGYRLDPARYADLRRTIEAVVRTHWQDAATLISMGSMWVRNLFDNLAALPGAGDFSSLTARAPVVVAGAGPSLEESLPVLKDARGSYLLAAADTALPRLAEESLEPDLVVALEAQVANIQDFIPHRGGGALLACELSAHPATARLFPGRCFFFASRFAPLALFGRLEAAGLLPCPFPALGSVGVAAAHAGLRMTSGEVFLTGLDFSFPGSRTHVRGTPHHLSALRATGRMHGVEQDSVRGLALRRTIRETGKTGSAVLTDLVLRSYRDGLRMQAAASAGRIWDMGATGLDLGVGRVDEEGFLRRVRAAGAGRPRIEVREQRAFAVEEVRKALAGEVRLLEQAGARFGGLLRAGHAGCLDAESKAILEAAGYAVLHFPDREAAAAPSSSYLARARVAALYYAGRVSRVLESLSPPRS